MKIVHVIPSLFAGGAEILMSNMAIASAKLGHTVLICCLFPPDESWKKQLLSKELEEHCNVIVLNESIRFRFLRSPILNNKKFIQLISSFKPDIIHSHLYLSELLVYSHVFKGCRYFSHGHDNIVQLNPIHISSLFNKSKITNWWEKRWLLAQYAKAKPSFIAISKDVEVFFNKVLPRNKFVIHYLPNAINVERFAHNRTYENLVKPFKLISIANLVPKKNHTYLIDVAAVLASRRISIRVEVLGDGPLMDDLKLKVKRHGLEDIFFFLGSVGDVSERLKSANLYVHPAWYEPFGLVLLEAMASGLPVVCLDGYGNRELMFDGKNGYILPVDTTAELFADKIEYFINNTNSLKEQGLWAAQFAKRYDIHVYAQKLCDIYQKSIES